MEEEVSRAILEQIAEKRMLRSVNRLGNAKARAALGRTVGPKPLWSIPTAAAGWGPPMPHQFRLAQVMCARLCHDLVGPAGTVEGAISLVGTAGADEAMEVARDALAALRARLALFRAAWGGGLGDSTLSELLALLDGQVAGGRERVELAAGAALRPDTVLAAPLAQLVLNAVLLGGEALPRGGTVVLAGDPAQTLAVCPEGPSAVWPPGALTRRRCRSRRGPCGHPPWRPWRPSCGSRSASRSPAHRRRDPRRC
jgi:histidine phosphotransferase ChpT